MKTDPLFRSFLVPLLIAASILGRGSIHGQTCCTLAETGCIGSLDASFNARQITFTYFLPQEQITALLVQTNGKVIVGGPMQSVQGINCGGLARFNADGSLDRTFTTRVGEDSYVGTLVAQPDGKLLISGTFGAVNDVPCSGIVRLDADGNLDTTFQFTNVVWGVLAIAVQPDNRILASIYWPDGEDDPVPFTVMRLHPDGALDESFQFEARSANPITNLLVQTDGHIIFDGPRRCDANGLLDFLFQPDVGPMVASTAILQPDDKIIVGGWVRLTEDRQAGALVQVNPDGSIDPTFSSSIGRGWYGAGGPEVRRLLLQPDGRLLIGGRFDFVGNERHALVARLNSDGSVDHSFQSDMEFCGGCDDSELVSAMGLAPDNKLLVGGFFSRINGLSRPALARLQLAPDTCDGVITFGAPEYLVSETNATAEVTICRRGNTNTTVAVSYATPPEGSAVPGRDYLAQSGGLTFLPGETTKTVSIPLLNDLRFEANSYFDVTVQSLSMAVVGAPAAARVTILDDEAANKPGSIDFGFHAVGRTWQDNRHSVVAVDLCGSIYVVQLTDTFPDSSHVYRLNSDGARDSAFDVPVEGTVFALATDSSNRVIVAGDFPVVNGMPRKGLARLWPNGSLDATFDAHVNQLVGRVLVLTNGQIYIAGPFDLVGGIPRAGLARLNENGSLDPSFDPGAGAHYDWCCYNADPGPIESLAVQADGKLIIGGYFSTVNGLPLPYLARLNINGTLDTDFAPPPSLAYGVQNVIVQPDQKILVAPRGRFNPDGSIDATFHLPAGTYPGVSALQPDGKIILNGLTRVNPDGSLDPIFFAGQGVSYGNFATCIVLPDGKILLAGDFRFFNEVPCPGLVRLNGGEAVPGPGQFVFSAAITNVSENVGALEVRVRRQFGTVGDVSVSFATADESARAGVDYVPRAGILAFTNGEAGERVISVPIINDTNVTGDRRFTIDLTAPTGGATLGLPWTLIVDILEDDVGVAFQTNQLWCLENWSAAWINVVRLGPKDRTFSVTFAATAGTASAGVDFVPVVTNLVFNAGDYSHYAIIPLLDDATPGPDKSILISLQGATDGVPLADPHAATLWVADNDRPPCIVPGVHTSRGFGMTFDVPMQVNFALETSTNLLDWDLVMYFYRDGIPLHFEDPRATNHPCRFYRLIKLY